MGKEGRGGREFVLCPGKKKPRKVGADEVT